MPKRRYKRRELPLWEEGAVEWHVIMRCDPPKPQQKHQSRVIIIQPSLLLDHESRRTTGNWVASDVTNSMSNDAHGVSHITQYNI
jgi:hypothetical protein